MGEHEKKNKEMLDVIKSLKAETQQYILVLAKTAQIAEESVRKNLDSSKQKATS